MFHPSRVVVCGAALIGLACAAPPVKQARFVIHEMKVDASCSTLFDHCARGTCMVENVGDAAGSATLKFELTAPGASTVTGSTSKLIAAGQLVPVSYDFQEAQMMRSGEVLKCSLMK